jgi:MOSC domain-containing protein YiiM
VRLVSVNVGRPRRVEWGGRQVRSAIWKAPVTGRVRVTRLNLEGDKQSDLRVHGGPNKAVYAYPAEHYAFWRAELPSLDLPWGAFGENLTIEGLLETEVRVGDRLRVGTAELRVTTPRMPCYKLTVRFDREDMVRRFMDSGRTGFYLAVEEEGELGAGDAIERSGGEESEVTIAELVARRQRREMGP